MVMENDQQRYGQISNPSFSSSYYPHGRSRKMSIGLTVEDPASVARKGQAIGRSPSLIFPSSKAANPIQEEQEVRTNSRQQELLNHKSEWVSVSAKKTTQSVQFYGNRMSSLQCDDGVAKKFDSVAYSRKSRKDGKDVMVEECAFKSTQIMHHLSGEREKQEPVGENEDLETNKNSDSLRMKLCEILGSAASQTEQNIHLEPNAAEQNDQIPEYEELTSEKRKSNKKLEPIMLEKSKSERREEPMPEKRKTEREESMSEKIKSKQRVEPMSEKRKSQKRVEPISEKRISEKRVDTTSEKGKSEDNMAPRPKQKHNSDTIETDSESPNATARRPITRSVARRRKPSIRSSTMAELQFQINGGYRYQKSCINQEDQKKNIFVFDEGGGQLGLINGHISKFKGKPEWKESTIWPSRGVAEKSYVNVKKTTKKAPLKPLPNNFVVEDDFQSPFPPKQTNVFKENFRSPPSPPPMVEKEASICKVQSKPPNQFGGMRELSQAHSPQKPIRERGSHISRNSQEPKAGSYGLGTPTQSSDDTRECRDKQPMPSPLVTKRNAENLVFPSLSSDKQSPHSQGSEQHEADFEGSILTPFMPNFPWKCRAVTQFALGLERFESKIKSQTAKRSSEILASAAEIIKKQLQHVECQIQSAIYNLRTLSKAKRKRLELRFQDQQERLRLIQEKFKEDINQLVQDCKSAMVEFEEDQLTLRAKAETESMVKTIIELWLNLIHKALKILVFKQTTTMPRPLGEREAARPLPRQLNACIHLSLYQHCSRTLPHFFFLVYENSLVYNINQQKNFYINCLAFCKFMHCTVLMCPLLSLDDISLLEASHKKLLLQVEKEIHSQLRDAERNISSLRKDTREKMRSLKHMLGQCLAEGSFG
ncbi:meiosis-specific protein ASY3 [Amborella trichopoda]|uniref:meiosis-specific protein ASY3 n=1 Tax=Amborella trichopoda TaxID=13333 RepID=UPI0009BD2B1C|nr:meiosis-specific protein ASY3 [Amborella trichopoda]|eukprot:XP_020520520.1 meiosis-specific protein ASY3 [Amborella trichopoda]